MDISQYKGKALKAKRIQRGLTMQEMATMVGVHTRTIARWESDKDVHQPRPRHIAKIIRALELGAIGVLSPTSPKDTTQLICLAVLETIIKTCLDPVSLASIAYLQRVYDESIHSESVPLTPDLASLLIKVQAH